jgi:hypothetical protein
MTLQFQQHAPKHQFGGFGKVFSSIEHVQLFPETIFVVATTFC